MSNPILEGMIGAWVPQMGMHADHQKAMRAALLWLADNVPDLMLHAAKAEADVQDAKGANEVDGARAIFAAALRAAAGSAPTTPEVK